MPQRIIHKIRQSHDWPVTEFSRRCKILAGKKPGLRKETRHFVNVTMVGVVFRTPATHYIINQVAFSNGFSYLSELITHPFIPPGRGLLIPL